VNSGVTLKHCNRDLLSLSKLSLAHIINCRVICSSKYAG
jgi:hypothetical protein